MSRISEEISNIFGFTIHEGEWKKYLPQMDVEGEPTRANTAKLLFAVCEELEELEKKLEGAENVERTTQRRNTQKSV